MCRVSEELGAANHPVGSLRIIPTSATEPCAPGRIPVSEHEPEPIQLDSNA